MTGLEPGQRGAERGHGSLSSNTPRPRLLARYRAFLPGAVPGQVDLGPEAAMAAVRGGTAVRTGRLSLEQVRAALLTVTAGGTDVTLYPVVE